MDINDKVRHCPIIDKEIKIEECFDVCMVIEDGCPESFAREDLVAKQGYKDICSNCFYHKNM